MALFSWVPIFVDWTQMTYWWGSKFLARVFSFIIHTEIPYRGYWNSWIRHSTKTTKIGTPPNLSHPQYQQSYNARKNTERLKFQDLNICPNILQADADTDARGIVIALLHLSAGVLKTSLHFQHVRLFSWLDLQHPTKVYSYVFSIISQKTAEDPENMIVHLSMNNSVNFLDWLWFVM